LELGGVLARADRLLLLSLPLHLLGVPCWTGVPGALLTLWAYLLVDGQMHHLDAGALPVESLARLERVKRRATGLLLFSVASFLLQAWLLSHGVGPLWASLLLALQGGSDSPI
jgi:hypothetical protein